MNPFAAIGVAGLTVLAAASPAGAYSFSPTNVTFIATGPITLDNGQASIGCTVEVKGNNKTGKAKITRVFFFGAGSCTTTAATGLPWQVLATGPGAGKIKNLGLTGPFMGSCASRNVSIRVGPAGVWFFNTRLAPACAILGDLPTSPPITVVP